MVSTSQLSVCLDHAVALGCQYAALTCDQKVKDRHALSLQAVAQKVLDIRGLLPGVNVSRLLAQYPYLIAQLDPGKVSQQLHLLRLDSPHKVISLDNDCISQQENCPYIELSLLRLKSASPHSPQVV